MRRGGEDQLAEAAARRADRVELPGREPREPDRLGRLDDRAPVRQQQEAGRDGPAERIGDLGFAPVAAEGRVENLGCPVAAVGQRQLVGLDARLREPPSQRAGRVARARARP